MLWWSRIPAWCCDRDFRLHRSLRKTLRNTVYEVRVDSSFEAVMRACAELRPDQDGTWISEAIIAAYTNCTSEAWRTRWRLGSMVSFVGGLYGIALGRVFLARACSCDAPTRQRSPSPTGGAVASLAV